MAEGSVRILTQRELGEWRMCWSVVGGMEDIYQGQLPIRLHRVFGQSEVGKGKLGGRVSAWIVGCAAAVVTLRVQQQSYHYN